MATRYSKRDRTKLVNRVKKLLAQGKTVNAACTLVSEGEGGVPATNTLANWVRAAGLSDGAAEISPAAPVKRRRKPRIVVTETPAATVDVLEADADISSPEADAQVEPAPAPDTVTDGSEVVGDGIHPLPPVDEPAAELVHVRTADAPAESDLDDLLDENHRLRTALTEANREIRAMRDLLVVYASR
ncbi:hypothetical protein [Nocardia sp. NBC_00416]|uniref:hypothetical protein n=1 Tax=Nocardia sp. NBC_00416 TaxID=2975991 RepID=UPI002E22CE2B